MRRRVGLVMRVAVAKADLYDGPKFLQNVERVVNGGAADLGMFAGDVGKDARWRRMALAGGKIAADDAPLLSHAPAGLANRIQKYIGSGHTLACA